MDGVVIGVAAAGWDALAEHIQLRLQVRQPDGTERQETLLLYPPVAAMLLCELDELLLDTGTAAPGLQ